MSVPKLISPLGCITRLSSAPSKVRLFPSSVTVLIASSDPSVLYILSEEPLIPERSMDWSPFISPSIPMFKMFPSKPKESII